MTPAERLRDALLEGIAHAKGEITLRTVTLRVPGPAPKLGKARVLKIRRKTRMSQSVFARYLNVPVRTLQSWEQGLRTPKAGEARLLQLFEAEPERCIRLVDDGTKQAPVRAGA